MFSYIGNDDTLMYTTFLFIANAAAFGVGLAMDAFSISIAAGLAETHMKKSRMCLIAGTFGGFQILMPLAGWFCVHTVAQAFSSFQKFIPWIAFILLGYIGGKMLLEGIRQLRRGEDPSSVNDRAGSDGRSLGGKAPDAEAASASDLAVSPVATPKDLLLLGVATAIDALSVGFTIADLTAAAALAEALIIGIVTFVICWCGLRLGKRAGARLSDKAAILGGTILVLIGIEILVRALL